MREWKRNNPEKVKKHEEIYWERKAAKLKAGEEETENVRQTQSKCLICGNPVEGRKKYCSTKCRQTAYRNRKKRQ